jgi:hypothetical protein
MRRKLAFVVLLLGGAAVLATFADIKPLSTKVVALPKPLYRFEVQGIKRIFTSPSKVTFQVQYYISPTYANACYIGAYIPDKAHVSSAFGLNPAGRAPAGVPKGQKWFADNVTFDMKYVGSGDYASSTIEVVIYNAERILGSSIIHWGQTWKRFDIQGIKRVVTRPEYVKFQVQYYIDPDYANACYIGAYIPDRAHQNAGFSYHPAGVAPAGVPKGQHGFADNVWFDAAYSAAVPFTSATIEVVIYESGRNLRTQVIDWGQTWSTEVH